MYSVRLIFLFAVAALVQCFGKSNGESLEAKLAGAKLPAVLDQSTAVYDGNDSVYIFGGRYNGSLLTADILRYSISLDTIEKVSSLSRATDRGLALQAGDGKSIYYFGGYSNPTLVHKFSSKTNLTERLPTALPSPVSLAGGVSINESIFIFNGDQRNILEFNQVSETAKIIGDLPFVAPVRSTTAILNGQDGVWIFAGEYPKLSNPVLFFNAANKVVCIPTVNTTSLPVLYAAPVSVWDGNHGYLIGGLGRMRESDGSYHPTNGIITVSLDDASTKFTPVTSYPGVNGTVFDLASAVYVEKINRIYIFGGTTFTTGIEKYQDSIWYIDLPSPPAFDCSNLTQGSYPHPTDCASFFICLDEELAGEFRCSSHDLFDPIQQTCNVPELVVCFFTCEGREGLFPHPSDCSKFVGCREGTSAIEVFDCPEPLLFDPVLLKCNLPQLVNCTAVLPGL